MKNIFAISIIPLVALIVGMGSIYICRISLGNDSNFKIIYSYLVKNEPQVLAAEEAISIIETPCPEPIISSNSYGGGSIIQYLLSIGSQFSFEYRTELAKKYGIAAYTGTAQQNISLLNLIRAENAQPKDCN